MPGGLTPRLLDAEQSNTSLVYGDAFILKVFRRVQPGVNPDLEVPLALARQSCARVPAPAAWFGTSQPRDATLGVLQPYLRDASDGWALALSSLASDRDFGDEAYELGRATAEVHLALADAFPVDPPSPGGTKRLAEAMHERLDAAVRSVSELRPHTAWVALRVRRARRPGLPWPAPPSASTATSTSARCCGPGGGGR